jgi:hypothetical protein
MFQTKVVEKTKTRFVFSNFFFSENCAFCEITREKYRRATQAIGDSAIRRMRIACWISKATDTVRICNAHRFSTARVVTQMRLSVR